MSYRKMKRKSGYYSSLYGESSLYWKYPKYSTASYSTPSVSVSTKIEPTKEQVEAMERIKRTMLLARNKYVNSVSEANEDTDKKNVYFPAKGGIYLKSKITVGGNDIQVIEKVKECALLDAAEEGINDLKINNRIPSSIIKEVIGSFNLIYKEYGDEAAAQVYRKRDSGEYFIYYPEQKISKASVSYPDDPNIQTLRTENELVCELHSHNSMSAFWSGTDDANENEVCFYVVLGTFDKDVTYKARVKCNAFQKDLKLYEIFELTEDEEKDILKKDNIGPGNEEIKSKVIKYSAPKLEYCGSEYLTNPYYDLINYGNVSSGKIQKETKEKEKEKVKEKVANTNYITYLDDVEFSTRNYLESLSCDYNAADINNSDVIRFFDARNLREIRDDLGVIDSIEYTHGYNLLNIYNKESRTKNLDARAHAFLLKSYLASTSYDLADDTDTTNKLYTADGFIDVALSLNHTDLVASNWNLVTFWEMLSKYQKALIANVFDQNVLLISQFVHERSNTNYYFIDFLSHIIHAPDSVLKIYSDFVEDVCNNFNKIVDDVDSSLASDYESLSMLELYFERCLDEHVTDGEVISIDDIIYNNIKELEMVNEFSDICAECSVQ